MKEILVWGNPEKEFERLGVQPKLTWQGYGWDKDEEMRVYEVNEDDFKILCEEDNDEYWQDAGWRYCEGSNQGIPQSKAKVNGKDLICWYEPYVDEEDDEDDEPYYEEFKHLLQYLCDSVGASQPRNVCALVADLAKYNNMTMAELFKEYQEDWELNDRVVSINIIDEEKQYTLRCKRDCVVKCKKCGKERDLLQRDIKDNQVIPDSCECGGKNQFRYWLDHFIEE
jgi:hypothetical protein